MRWIVLAASLLLAIPAAANWTKGFTGTTQNCTILRPHTGPRVCTYNCTAGVTCADASLSTLLNVNACTSVDVTVISDIDSAITFDTFIEIYDCLSATATPTDGGVAGCYLVANATLTGNPSTDLEQLAGFGLHYIYALVEAKPGGGLYRLHI